MVVQYLGYVKNKFRPSYIVFDGYNAGPSIKDHEHQQRAARTSANIQIDDALQVEVHQETFLSYDRNKDQFVKMLHSSLEADALSVVQYHSDADTDIISEALWLATQGHSVTAVAPDTGILVLLLYHISNDMAIYLL